MPTPIGAIDNNYLVPAVTQIAAITNAFPALVTTTFAHGYNSGAIVRLYIPLGFGMSQARYVTGSIAVASPTTFTISVDTSTFDPFVIPAWPGAPAPYQTAECVPVGEDNDRLDSSFRNILTPLY